MNHLIGSRFMEKKTKLRVFNATQLCLNSYHGLHGKVSKISTDEEFVKFKDKRDTMTVGTAYDGSDVYLCFQGSQERSDWRRNFNKEMLDLDDHSKVHEGFFEHFHKFREEVSEKIDKLLKHDFDKIIVCGHSLGGALATLCCYELMYKKYHDYKDRCLCVTLGSPRVGNYYFSFMFNSEFDCFRLVYGSDIVCRLPKFTCWSWYYHVGHKIQLGESSLIGSFKDHLSKNYRDAFKKYLKIDLPLQ